MKKGTPRSLNFKESGVPFHFRHLVPSPKTPGRSADFAASADWNLESASSAKSADLALHDHRGGALLVLNVASGKRSSQFLLPGRSQSGAVHDQLFELFHRGELGDR